MLFLLVMIKQICIFDESWSNLIGLTTKNTKIQVVGFSFNKRGKQIKIGLRIIESIWIGQNLKTKKLFAKS